MAMKLMVYEMNKNGKPRRIIDKISMLMNKLGLFKARDYWTLEYLDNKTIGAIYTIEGSSIITRFLSWATKYHGNGNKVEVHMNNDGEITKVNNIES